MLNSNHHWVWGMSSCPIAVLASADGKGPNASDRRFLEKQQRGPLCSPATGISQSFVESSMQTLGLQKSFQKLENVGSSFHRSSKLYIVFISCWAIDDRFVLFEEFLVYYIKLVYFCRLTDPRNPYYFSYVCSACSDSPCFIDGIGNLSLLFFTLLAWLEFFFHFYSAFQRMSPLFSFSAAFNFIGFLFFHFSPFPSLLGFFASLCPFS